MAGRSESPHIAPEDKESEPVKKGGEEE